MSEHRAVNGRPAIDRVLIRQLQARVGARRGRFLESQRREGKRIPTGEDARRNTEALLEDVITDHSSGLVEDGQAPLDDAQRQALVDALKAELFGAGSLEQLLTDFSVEDIVINGWRNVFVRYADGTKAHLPPVASSDRELEEIVKTISAHDGLSTRPFDTVNYSITVRMADKSRLHAVQGITDTGLSISIRKHRHLRATLLPVPGLAEREIADNIPIELRTRDLLSEGTVDEDLADFLAALIRARKNVMIAGATGAGKTTMLRAMASEISPEERLITVERSIELGLHEDTARHPDMVAMEERPANVDGAGAVSLRELLQNSLRMRPDRVFVGEVLGGDEVITMLNAMMQGNDGSLSTIHANSARDVIEKIRTYASQSHERLPVEATDGLIAGALNFVVFLRELNGRDGVHRRVVESIVEVAGRDEDGVKTTPVWAFDTDLRRTVFTKRALRCEEELIEAGWSPEGALERQFAPDTTQAPGVATGIATATGLSRSAEQHTGGAEHGRESLGRSDDEDRWHI